MKRSLHALLGLLMMMTLPACSSLKHLDTETQVLGGALAVAAVVESTENTNFGLTHGIISFGVTHAVETFADRAFPEPEQEWIADTLTIIGAAVPAAYYVENESGDSSDSRADYLFPVGNFLTTAFRRLSREQSP